LETGAMRKYLTVRIEVKVNAAQLLAVLLFFLL